jgi:hypothetical protein
LEHVVESDPESIPLSSITAIVREIVTRKPVQEETNRVLTKLKPESLISTIQEASEGAGEAAVFAPTVPAFLLAEVGALTPFRGVKTHIESVRILWEENGIPRSSNFSLSGKDVDSLLDHLAQATSKGWAVVRFDAQAQTEHAVQVLVHFDEPVSVGDITVSQGSYRFLTITASDSTRLVYLFAEGRRLPSDAITVLTADASLLGALKPWNLTLVHNGLGSWCLSEIHTDSERLRLQACQPSK